MICKTYFMHRHFSMRKEQQKREKKETKSILNRMMDAEND